jgi:glycosyltransferase involved in cell wall biosynthesis
MAEMRNILSGDVAYSVLGAQVPEAGNRAGVAMRAVPFASRLAAQVRRSSLGAISYQRLRSGIMLRSASRGRLIHCCSHLIYGDSPWIGDYENVNVLGFYSPRLLSNARFVEHLRMTLSQPSCRAIRVWSDSARQSFCKLFPEARLNDKVRVIYPTLAFPAEAQPIRKPSTKPRLLFVARGFWVKGGALFLEAVKKLKNEFDFRADFICDLPPECRHYREELAGIVDFYEPNFSRQELFARFYSRADIFVMLGMADSYGLALLEASAFGLPIVAMRLNSGLSDLLRLTNNAIQLEPDHQIFDEFGIHHLEPAELVRRIRVERRASLVDRVASALEELISDRDRRAELGSRGRTVILEGSLSAAAMRGSMLEFYSTVTN